MQKKVICVYNINELDENAKQKAINYARENWFNYDWWDTVYEEYKQLYSKYGINDAEFKFSLYSCYAELTRGSFDNEKIVNMFLPNEENDVKQLLINNIYIYFFHSSITVEWCYTDEETQYIDDLIYELEKILNKKVDDLNIMLFNSLVNMYEYLTSDDAIIEEYKAKETLFLIDGTEFENFT